MGAPENFTELLDLLADPKSFQVQRRFRRWARARLSLSPNPRGDHRQLLPERWWQALLAAVPDQEEALIALSAATGLYFFPAREWPPRLLRLLRKLGIRRLLEAGAGRGYLTQALAPLCTAAGLEFRAVDRGDGEFASHLPRFPGVETTDAFLAARQWRPQAIVYAWPPPGQSLAPFFAVSEVRFIIVAGEAGGGVTGARGDWQALPHRSPPLLNTCCRGRTGQARHQVTIFWRGSPSANLAP